MKKTNYFLLFLFLIPFLAKAQDWKAMGPDDFNQASLVNNPSYPVTVAGTGEPTIAYVYDTKNIMIRKYSNNKWQTVADAVFAGSSANYVNIVFDDGTPYVAYADGANNSKLTVKKYNGNSWELLGVNGFSDNNTQKITMAFHLNVPYVMYTDGGSSRKITVKKFDGINWVAVGTNDVSGIYADYPTLAFNNSTPYVAYQDGNNNNKFTVKKYDLASNEWVAVGSAGVSNSSNISLAFSEGTPYISYTYNYGSGLAVQKFDGTNWVAVGTDVSTSSSEKAIIRFSGNVPYVLYKDMMGQAVKKLNATTSTWETVGDLNSGQSGPGGPGGGWGNDGDLIAINFISSKPYIVYLEGYDTRVVVKQFNGTAWESLGGSGISAGGASKVSLASDGTSAYIAYIDHTNNDKLSVQKYNGTAWEAVGTPGFSAGQAYGTPMIALNGNVPYVAFGDNGHNAKLVVQYFNGSTWELLGTPLSSGNSYYSDLAFNNGEAYVAYSDYDNASKISVKKFNKNSEVWETVGNAGFSDGRVNEVSLTFLGNQPYVAYSDRVSRKITVKKLDGSVWKTAGNTSLGGDWSSYPNLAVNENQVYLTFNDGGDGNIKVYKYNANDTWEPLGASLGGGYNSKLLFDNEVAYVAYQDASNAKLAVKKFVGNNWEAVGNADLSAGQINYLGLSKANGKLVVAYSGYSEPAFAKSFTLPTPAVTPNQTVYVTENGAGTQDGSSWANATADLQQAIQKSTENVYVAGGTYKPIYPANTDFSGAYTAEEGNRDNAFVLKKDVKVYGGFAGTEATLADRDLSIRTNASILSGDIDNNDTNGDVAGNSYHVLVASGVVGSAELNGFTITAGNANETGNSSVNNYTINKNSGGGMYIQRSSPFILNVIVENNMAQLGAGIYNAYSDPILTNVRINGNTADQKGGGVYNHYETLAFFTNATIVTNKAPEGGGMFNEYDGNPRIYNSVIWGNTDLSGGVNNIKNSMGNPRYKYSLVEGSNAGWSNFGTDLGNNVDGNPMFTDLANGNFTLQASSPAINAGSNSFYAEDQTPDLSTITFDLAGNLRFNGTVDMGAYEYEGVLPVTLVNFTAKAETNGARLTWQTASEQNNIGFSISRSTDGINFTAIGTVSSKGNGNGLSNYTFVDVSPANGTNYYRLQQKDTDGKINDLGVRSVAFTLAEDGVSVYPNPTADMATIKFASGNFNSATLLDLSGKVLAQQVLNAEQNEAQFNLSAYTTGTYVIRLVGTKESKSFKVVKF